MPHGAIAQAFLPLAVRSPAVPNFDIRSLYRRPGDTMRRFLLSLIPDMRSKGMVERLAINVLRMGRQVVPHRSR